MDAPLHLRVEQLVELAAVVFSRHPEVSCAYLFGSLAHGRAGAMSDIDLAVYRDPGYRPIEDGWNTYWGEIHAELVHELGLRDDELDLVILNEAKSSLLAHRATWKGRLIFCRDHRARVALETAILRQYLDAAPLRHLMAMSLRQPTPNR